MKDRKKVAKATALQQVIVRTVIFALLGILALILLGLSMFTIMSVAAVSVGAM